MKNLLFILKSFKGFTMKRYINYFLVIWFTLVYIGCQGTNEPTTTDPYAQKITDAWGAFSQANYGGAYDLFNQARVSDTTKADAYLGLGWSKFKLDSLTSAAASFILAARAGLTSADLYAGRAFVANAAKQYEQSIEYAGQALTLNPNWVFAYQSSLNKNDLQLLQAQNYYQLGNFATSLTYVKLLNISFAADVNTAAGRLALADEIERLKSL